MNSRFFKSMGKPVIGILVLTIVAIIFLTIGSFNEAMSFHVMRAEDFRDVVMSDIEINIDHSHEHINDTKSLLPLERIIFDLELNEVENPVFSQTVKDMMTADIEFENVVLMHNEKLVMTEGSLVLDDELNYLYYDYEWHKNVHGDFRYHVITKGDMSYLLIETPASEKYIDYQVGFVVEFDEILPSHLTKQNFTVHILTREGKPVLLGPNSNIVTELQNAYNPNIFNPTMSLTRESTTVSINDFHFYNDFIFVSDNFYGLIFVIAKPYDKYQSFNDYQGLISQIMVFGILMVAVVATIIYSSQKTKKWIDIDKQFLNDIIEMDKLQISELKKELKFYKDYFLESKLPIMFVDKETYRIVNANRAAISYYDYSEDEINNLYLTDICQWEKSEPTDIIRMEHIKRNGKREIKPVRLQDGFFNDAELLILMVMSDQRVDTEADRMRLEIFHEIRSPLQGAVGAVEMIESATSNFTEYTNLIKRSLNNVLMMTNNVLASGKFGMGDAPVSKSDFELVTLLDEVVATTVYQDKHYNLIAGQVQENNNDLLTTLDAYTIHSDMIKLRQILLNLMSNASKYTIDGLVNITIDITRGVMKDIVVFRVTDTGEGLSKEEIDHLFDDFSTFSNNTDVTSTGIGMGITKKYLEMLGAELHISSEKGVGTTFSFSLESKGTLEDQVEERGECSVLIVDDDDISCEYLKHLLSKEMNAYVKSLTNETQVLTELNQNHYDCLLIDQNLNHFNGLDLIRLIRSSINNRFSDLPIVLITASLDDFSHESINEVIHKPFDNEHVVRAIRSVLETNEDHKHHACDLVDEDILNKEIICDTFEAVGREVFIELIQKFQVNSYDEIETIKSHIVRGDYSKVAAIIHRLKGSMSYFAPIKCMKYIGDIEAEMKNETPNISTLMIQLEEAHKELVYQLNILLNEV
ncbi:response regulator [Acidaminobacter sp. JC074]|uniref:hybrid sensor histidine kinase/response regulator n=1 Tax=Acidaminobacter sp. JC074 TaxID=2530199 RepID=UPI001F0E15D3|nr:hybrid sensor histidine kinase/response regulator [Acidaminobacter sp. JC074]MCH4890416.1 response regulator [Acidaminobacter sp. JC074]